MMFLPTSESEKTEPVEVVSIAKNFSWKILFFTASCCVLAAALISIVDLVVTFRWAPVSFTAQGFLLFFGILMFVLDFPVSHNSYTITSLQSHIYKFVLFMTRFTGRGLWYTFLGSMIFVALFDLKISLFFGVLLGGFVCVLGIVTTCYGVLLSRKLNSVRLAVLASDFPQECPSQGFSKQDFRDLARRVNQTDFADDELDYVINGLSFTAHNTGTIMRDEYLYWVSPGSMEIV
jgi:hypothetical protein